MATTFAQLLPSLSPGATQSGESRKGAGSVLADALKEPGAGARSNGPALGRGLRTTPHALGVGSQLNVVSFKGGEATIVYSWDGEGLYPFHITGTSPSQALSEKAD